MLFTEIYFYFSYGVVQNLVLFRRTNTAFFQYAHIDSAEKAISSLNGYKIGECILSVSFGVGCDSDMEEKKRFVQILKFFLIISIKLSKYNQFFYFN